MSITDTIRAAWDATRLPHQPCYDDLVPSYQALLESYAQHALDENVPCEPPFGDFTRSVLDTKEPEELVLELPPEPTSEPPKKRTKKKGK